MKPMKYLEVKADSEICIENIKWKRSSIQIYYIKYSMCRVVFNLVKF